VHARRCFAGLKEFGRMRGLGASLLVALGGPLLAGFWFTASATTARAPADVRGLRPVAAFNSIADPAQKSVALFEEAGAVIQHPRCVNCHPAGNRPLQGDDMHPHAQLVVRGEDNLGSIAMRCFTCHREKNFEPGRVPGHPQWHLAPIEMAWEGKSLGEICEQIKDPKRNGGKSLDEIVTHMAEDTLVGWGWAPGGGRTPVPGTQAEFGDLIRAWAEAGAVCPAT
jgi:hypothetical protein